MKRIQKKLLKPFRKRGTSKSPAQITDISAEFGRDSDGEYPSRDLRADKPDGTDSTIAPGDNHGEGSQIANQDRRIGDQQLPTPDAGHDGGDASEWGRL
jgi:hypothetical protein